MDDKVLTQMLKSAIREGNLNQLKHLLKEHHENVESILNNPQHTFMNDACRYGHEKIVTLLTGYTDDVNVDSGEGTPLTIACRHGYLSIVDTLLTGSDLCLELPVGMDATLDERNKCPFNVAASCGWTDILEILAVENRAVWENMSCVEALLLSACCNGRDTVMEFCWRMKTCELRQSFVQQLLDTACHSNFANVVDLLVSKGAEITACLLLRYPDVVKEMLVAKVFTELQEDQQPSTRLNWDACNLHALHSDLLTDFLDVPCMVSLDENRLTNLLGVVPWGWKSLLTLSLQGNRLVRLDPPFVRNSGILCQSLYQVNLSHNLLSQVPLELFHIASLRSLDLSHNLLGSLPPMMTENFDEKRRNSRSNFYVGSATASVNMSSMWLTSELLVLDLSHNQLTHLPEQVRVCQKLQHLHVSFNKLCSFPHPWPCPLLTLNASNNLLSDLSEGWDICWGNSLHEVNLSSNNIININQSLCRLGELALLDMSKNKLRGLPPVSWWHSTHLGYLDLSHNLIKYVGGSSASKPRKFFRVLFRGKSAEASMDSPPQNAHTGVEFPVELLKNSLNTLNLRNNRLKEVPPSICQLSALNRLDLSHNTEMTVLAQELCELHKLQSLCIDGLSITNLPKKLQATAVFKTKSILAHLKHQMRRSEPYYGMKLLLVGNEGIGKTTLSALLRGLSPPSRNIATVGVEMADWRLQGDAMRQRLKESKSQQLFPDINFRIWDFAGQKDFTVTHKVFLSRYGLYLLLFDLRTHKQGVFGLRPWLLDIQAHAEKSHVIIVGTHLDFLTDRSSIPDLHKLIHQEFTQEAGYPHIQGVYEVSCSERSNEGIERLKLEIYLTASRIEVYIPSQSSRQTLIGRKVPKSYLDLQKVIYEEARRRHDRQEWLVLSRDEYHSLMRSNADNDIVSDEDVELATQFLHEVGTLLYYGQHSEQLRQLYFIDPSWLAQTLATFITVQAGHCFVKDGILHLQEAIPSLLKEKQHISIQIISVLEAFNIALKLDDDRLLITSKLLNEKPPVLVHPDTSAKASASRVQRLYRMRYIPSGMWCRLITQILAMLNRFSSKDSADRHIYSMVSDTAVKTTFWQQGLRVDWPNGYACVESACDLWQCKDGVLLTVADIEDNFSWLGFFVDQVDALIYQWYPGLTENPTLDDSNCEILIPCSKCCDSNPPYFFALIDCALSIVHGESHMTCVQCNSSIALSSIVPDVLLADLPSAYVLKKDSLSFDPDNDALGAGAEGVVYKALLNGHQAVAVKQSVLMHVVNYVQGKKSSSSSRSSDSSGTTTEHLRSRLMTACSSVRHEVGLMCGLQHPCIVALLGVYMPSLCYALEMAPLGSLRSVLNEKRKGSSLPQQSCILGSLLSFRIIYQIALGLSYLHSESIVYKDMKADNILVWSLDPREKNSVNVKLSDYGLSQYVGPQGLTGFEGTVGYQAPEMNDNSVYDNKIDIFACGMVIYEALTGSYPFEDMPSIAIAHAIQRGERPDTPDSSIAFTMPHLASLMKECWSGSPTCRPSAHDLIRRMAIEDFYALRATFREASLTSVTCVLGLKDQTYLRFWSFCNESLRCKYYVFDCKNGTMRVHGQPLDGPAVQCMLWINACKIIVAQDEELKLLSLSVMTGGIVVQSVLKCPAVPLRLLLCNADVANPDEESPSFLASLSNSQIISVSVAKKKLKMKTSPPLDNHGITALAFANDPSDLWVGCGHKILILNRHLEAVHTIELCGLRERRYISDIVCHGDTAWVAVNGSSVVHEYDMQARRELCQMDFGCSLSPGTFTISSHEEEDAQHVTVTTDTPCHAQYRRKRSLRHSKTRKRNDSCGVAEVTMRSVHRVRSVHLVRGTLWVGLSNGGVAVVNVTENNSHSLVYGEVLAVLCPSADAMATVCINSMPDDQIAVVSKVRPSSADNGLPVLVTMWRAFCLDDWVEAKEFFRKMAARVDRSALKWNNATVAGRSVSNPL